jgi:integrase
LSLDVMDTQRTASHAGLTAFCYLTLPQGDIPHGWENSHRPRCRRGPGKASERRHASAQRDRGRHRAWLFLQVEPTGTKTWVRRFRHVGVPKKVTLGRAGEDGLSLVAARGAAARHAQQLEQGGLPVAPVTTTTGDSVVAAAAQFLELYAHRKTRASTANVTEQIFNRAILPAWRGRSIQDLRRRDVLDLIESIARERGPYAANRALAVLTKFFNWLCARDVIASSPAQGVERPHREQARERILTDAELTRLWLACATAGASGDAIRMMVLTGARRTEVGEMRWSEIDSKRRVWVLPSARSKNHLEHIIPLSTQAWDILQARPRFAGCDFVFTTTGQRPVAEWARAKHRISTTAAIPEQSWRLHDLRRTTASGLQRLGVAVPVVERALNHVSGAFRGIVGTYQLHDYADEVRIGLQRWGDHVEQLVGGRLAKIVKLRQR